MSAEVPMATKIGSRIREARIHSGFTLAQLAQKAGIHPNTISSIERGKSIPTSETLNRMASALGRSLDELSGPAPVRAPEEQAVLAFLDDFRLQVPELFAEWPQAMWDRYTALGVRFGIANAAAARFFADQVNREFRCIRQLLDLFDANQADEVVSVLLREHTRWQEKDAGSSRRARGDKGHGAVPGPHHLDISASRRQSAGTQIEG